MRVIGLSSWFVRSLFYFFNESLASLTDLPAVRSQGEALSVSLLLVVLSSGLGTPFLIGRRSASHELCSSWCNGVAAAGESLKEVGIPRIGKVKGRQKEGKRRQSGEASSYLEKSARDRRKRKGDLWRRGKEISVGEKEKLNLGKTCFFCLTFWVRW